ncbi:hypothetical protein TNCV_2026851 [Trichonephila clavipes]|nr:hypothetical protein TNCV_2026851 [Trichonephila clavipes]
MVSAEYMEGPRTPEPQKCSAGCSVYWKCVLERYGSEMLYLQTMIPGVEPFWQCITLKFRSLSPRCLQTQIQPSCCCRQKRNSSLNTMLFHSVVHIRRSSHHWMRKPLWFPVKGNRSNGILTDILFCCKQLRMAQADTE